MCTESGGGGAVEGKEAGMEGGGGYAVPVASGCKQFTGQKQSRCLPASVVVLGIDTKEQLREALTHQQQATTAS